MCEATLVEAVKLFILCHHHRTLGASVSPISSFLYHTIS